MRPTTVVVAGAGSSASIRADGGVDFATATSLSLNGVFTAEYDNYMIVMGNLSQSTAAGQGFTTRLRASGSDNSTASSYVHQRLFADSTSVTAARTTDTFWFLAGVGPTGTPKSGNTIYLYGPYLAQPTAVRGVAVASISSAFVADTAATHNQSTAYDGITFSLASGNFTGMVTVYGYTQ